MDMQYKIWLRRKFGLEWRCDVNLGENGHETWILTLVDGGLDVNFDEDQLKEIGGITGSITRIFEIKTTEVLKKAVLAALTELCKSFESDVMVCTVVTTPWSWPSKSVKITVDISGTPLSVSKAVYRLELLLVELSKLMVC